MSHPSADAGAALRREDPPLVTGAAMFTGDLAPPGALHAVFVRAPLASGRILSIDTAAAAAMDGVAGVFGAADLDLPPMPAGGAPDAMARPVLAAGVVRFLGEAVAVVVAGTRAQALDAAEAVEVDYEPLPVLTDPLAALDEDAPRLFETGNLAKARRWPEPSRALEGAEVVVRARFVNQRVSAAPLEPAGSVAVPEPGGDGLVLYTPCQAPFWVRDTVAEVLGMAPVRVRVVVPAVGGAFGARIVTYPEQVAVAALARRLGRPVRHLDGRSETMLAMTHGRAQVQDVEVAATRGAGRPEATSMVERAVDLLAARLQLDPAEVRRRNLIPARAFPYTTATRARYDSGDYRRALDLVLEAAGYDELRASQARSRQGGEVRQLGIGLSLYVEVTGFGSEYGQVEVGPDGRVTARTGVSPHGQGHETAFARLVAGTLGVDPDRVTVVHSDTAALPRGDGTMGSRSLQVGGSAVAEAAGLVLDKARALAAHLLEAPAEDVVLFPGEGLGVAGAPETALGWGELAAAAADPARRPPGMDPGLEAAVDFELERSTFPFGAHLAVCEVDTESGLVRLLRHVAVDDSGRIHNPVLAEGQVQGGIAQGVAQALFEEVRYDGDGNCLNGSLASYAMPAAADLPAFETQRTETPTPLNPLGAKGIGESGTVGATPAVQNAVVDALSHLGVTHIDMPLTPERVWRAIRAAGGGA